MFQNKEKNKKKKKLAHGRGDAPDRQPRGQPFPLTAQQQAALGRDDGQAVTAERKPSAKILTKKTKEKKKGGGGTGSHPVICFLF